MKRIGKIQKIIVILMILIVITIAVCLLNIFIFKKNTTSTKKAEQTIKFNYSLYKRDSELFREIFNKLKTTLDSSNIDNNKYAEYITELFVADFYNINNKNNKNDVGGLQFIKEEMKENFILNATDTIYKYVENITNRTQELPEVKSVSMSNIESSKYNIDDNEYDSYIVSLNWEYTKDLGYENKGTFLVIKDGEQLYIVEKNS